jgi:hypothetical protein
MRNRITRAGAHALSLALATFAVGCKGGDSAPDCKAVGAAYATLQRQEIEKPTGSASAAASETLRQDADKQKQQALSLIPLVKEAIVAECEQKKWTAEARRCAVAATTPDDLERCRTRPEPAEAPAEGAGEDEAPAKAGEAAPARAPETAPQPQKSDSP